MVSSQEKLKNKTNILRQFQDDNIDVDEYESIKSAWIRAKKELQQKTDELNKLQLRGEKSKTHVFRVAAYNANEDSNDVNSNELKDRLRFTELQLASTRRENDKWSRDFDNLATKYEADKKEIRQLQQEKLRIQELETRCKIAEDSKEDLMTKSLAAIRKHETEMLRKTTYIHDLEDQLKDKSAECALLAEECAKYEKVKDRDAAEAATAAALREKLLALEEVAVTNSDLRAAADHLRVDNARLVALLASTAEYQEFLQHLEDSQGISYIPPESAIVTSARYEFTGAGGGAVTRSATSPKRKHPARGAEERYLRSKFSNSGKLEAWQAFQKLEDFYGTVLHGDREALEDLNEHEHWMPRNAFYVARRFRDEHIPQLPLDLLTSFLRRLNAVWKSRESWRVDKVKEKYKKKIAELRRMLNHRVPYDHVMQKKKVSRLEANVKGLRANYLNSPWINNSRARRVTMKSRTSHPSRHSNHLSSEERTERGKANLVEACLSTIEDVKEQLAVAHAENARLHRALNTGSRSSGASTF